GYTDGVNGNQVGTAGSPLDPKLGPLGNNGGTTLTRAVLTGSPAYNAGDTADCQTAPVGGSDERHHSRHAGARDHCDIGSYDTGGLVSLTEPHGGSTGQAGDPVHSGVPALPAARPAVQGGDAVPFVPVVEAPRVLLRNTPPAELDELLGPARRDLARLLPELDLDASRETGSDLGSTGRLFELILGLVSRLAARQ